MNIAEKQEADPLDRLDLTLCDREPIHIPGSIQPHGLLLVVDPKTLKILAGAGDIETRLATDWLGKPLAELLNLDVAPLIARMDLTPGGVPGIESIVGTSENFDLSIHRSGDAILVELEPAATSTSTVTSVLTLLEAASASFGRAADLETMCTEAVKVFRQLTGFDRVLIYRFLDEDVGRVVAEAQDPDIHSFLHHHFPASDIPRQARALYIRNRIRVIPDVHYTPAPMRPLTAGYGGVDMSDIGLRSVSPIHVQYLKNMDVAASASVSIVKDGILWGLVACHNRTPRNITYDVRAACRSLAASLGRQILAKEEAEAYRERLRLRRAEDAISARLGLEDFLDTPHLQIRDDIQRMFNATGFATVEGDVVDVAGECPSGPDILALAQWIRSHSPVEAFASHQLASRVAPAVSYQALASGVLAVNLSTESNSMLIWFRAEQVQMIEWAGNPHKAFAHDPNAVLNPRSSFEAWSEAVRGQSQPWTLNEIESANRLKIAILEERQNRRLRDLNRKLSATLADKESLLRQKDYLVKEVNHRVQNSLQLVSAFLSLQVRSVTDPVVAGHLNEAMSRLSAVALVHKRLYRDDNVETVDLARYLEDLCSDARQSMGAEWREQLALDLAPILISADRAVNVGLVLTELMINANKYAYHGAPGYLSIRLEQYRNRLRLIVSDRGTGAHKPGKGFGTRMMQAMIDRLGGTIEFENNEPGLRVVVTAPIEETAI